MGKSPELPTITTFLEEEILVPCGKPNLFKRVLVGSARPTRPDVKGYPTDPHLHYLAVQELLPPHQFDANAFSQILAGLTYQWSRYGKKFGDTTYVFVVAMETGLPVVMRLTFANQCCPSIELPRRVILSASPAKGVRFQPNDVLCAPA